MSQNIFRVFISSTFKDFEAERRVLQERVFPKLEKECRDKGASFLGVDLRWGIPPELGRHNQTMQTCLEEISRCQRLSPKPNFFLLLGDRYGWLPPPEKIDSEVYRKLEGKFSDEMKAIFPKWYQEDSNSIPAVWCLKPRHDVEDIVWEEISEKLRNGFLKAADDAALSEEEKIPFKASATHQEIKKGILALSSDADDHVFVWRRKLDSDEMTKEERKTYRDVGLGDQHCQLEKLAADLKDRLGQRYQEHNEKVKLSDLNNDNSEYLKNFEEKAFKALWEKIKEQIDQSPQNSEEEIHRKFAEERAQGFVGRAQEIGAIGEYLKQPARSVHFIRAPGGMGKTSLLAKCVVEQADDEWLVRFAGASPKIGTPRSLLLDLWPEESVAKKCKAVDSYEKAEEIIRRLYSKSPKLKSDSLRRLGSEEEFEKLNPVERSKLLREEFDRGRNQFVNDMTIGLDAPREKVLCDYLKTILWLRGTEKLVLVIDALDQVQGFPDLNYLLTRIGQHVSRDLPEHLSRNLPENVWVITSLRDENEEGLKGLAQADWKSIIDDRLGSAKRKLSKSQRDWIAKGVESSEGKPLALKLSTEFALKLRSWDSPPDVKINVPALVGHLYDQLDAEHRHGLLGSRALAYLSYPRHGVPEQILLDTLANDTEVAEWFGKQVAQTGNKWDLKRGLPPILWSRIQMDLESYLVFREAFGSSVIDFFHREFREQASAYADQKLDSSALALGLAKSAWRKLAGSDHNFALELPADLYKKFPEGWALAELPWLLENAGWSNSAGYLLESPAFIMAKLGIPGGVESLYEDYSRHEASPWAALFHSHYADLLGHRNPRDLLIQRAWGQAESSLIRERIEKWLNDLGDYTWIGDETRKRTPLFSISKKNGGSVSQLLSDDRAVDFDSKEYSSVDVSTATIFNPDSLTEPVYFLENYWWHKEFTANKKFVGIVPVKGTDFVISRHKDGPILIWRGEQLVAKLQEFLTIDRAEWELDLFPGSRQKEIEITASVSAIFADRESSFIAVYDDGRVLRWTLPESLKSIDAQGDPVVLRTDGANCTTLAEPEVEYRPNEPRKLQEFLYHEQGLVLVFAESQTTVRVVIISGDECQDFYSTEARARPTLCSNDFSPFAGGCYFLTWPWTGDLIVQLTSEGEKALDLKLQPGELPKDIWVDGNGGLLLTVDRDYPNEQDPWSLRHFKPDGSGIWSENWRVDGLDHKTPIYLSNSDSVMYSRDGQIMLLRIADPINEVPAKLKLKHWPVGVKQMGGEELVGWSGEVFYTLNLNNGETRECVTGGRINKVWPREKDYLVSNSVGLEAWSLNCYATTKYADFKATHVEELPDGSVLACAPDCFRVWGKENNENHEVWTANEAYPEDKTYVVTTLQEGVITWGSGYIRIWSKDWQIRQQLSLPPEEEVYQGKAVKAVLPAGENRYLFEHGNGVGGRGRYISLLKLTEGIWQLEQIPLERQGDWKYFELITPVMSDGDVAFRVDSEDPSDPMRYIIYNLENGKSEWLPVDNQQLVEWLKAHRETFEDTLKAIKKTLYAQFDGLVDGDTGASRIPMLESGFDFEQHFNNSFFGDFPASVSLKILERPGLGGFDWRNIGVQDQKARMTTTYYTDKGYKLWVNQLNKSGRLYLTDRNSNLLILQLMRGSVAVTRQVI